MRRILSIAALTGLVLGPGAEAIAASSGGGTSGGGVPTDPGANIMVQEKRISEDTQIDHTGMRDPTAAFQISGRVYNGSGEPMAGILVKMFTNGTIAAHAKTDVDGAFSIEANPMTGGNNTTDLWFESPDPEAILDSNVVLATGKVARERGLIPSCTQKVDILGSFAEVEVIMMTPDQRKESLEQSQCLEQGGAQ
jgi:hypothetical protein